VTDVGVIDQFLAVFSRYIDSGFGLVRGDVGALARILVAIDVSLAALFWAWGPGEEILARLVRKILYVGLFAFLLADFQRLAQRVFDSFAGLGLKAGGGTMSAADLMRPGRVAQAGVDAVRPLLAAAGEMAGFPQVFDNAVQIGVLLASVLVVLVAFFVLAVQLFVTVLEFKLTTLAGFVLAPFGLFGRTAFLAERVLGMVVASGVKVLVLAVIVGIGSTLFSGFVSELGGETPDLDRVLAVALGALSLLGLGVFGPGIASGLVSGGPQLGAGSAAATALGAGGLAVAGGAGVRAAAGGAAAVLRGTRTLAAQAAGRPGPGGPAGGGAPSAPAGSPPSRGPPPAGAGPGPGISAPAARGALNAGPSSAAPPSAAPSSGTASAGDDPPPWARRLRDAQALAAGVSAAAATLRAGDGGAGALAIPLDEDKP
jgi:type IV secretion system protein TrbL